MAERDFNEVDDQRIAYRLLSDILDSTTSALTAGSTYTGDAFDVEGYQSVVLSFYADQDALVRIQFRNDESNWDAQKEYDYTADEQLGMIAEIAGNEARIEIENDSGSDMTTMREHARGKC